MSAAQVPGAVQAAQAVSASGVSQAPLAAVSGQQQATLPQQPQPDSTLQVLTNIAAPVLGPAIQRARTAALVSGMQRAAAGETIQQIAAERPWFAQVFGDGDAVAGARLYEVNARSASVASGIMSGMDEYAKLDAGQFKGVVSGALQDAMTGDAEADASIMQAAARHLPQVFAAHTQASIKYGRVRTAGLQVSSILSEADLYQAAAGTELGATEQTKKAYASAFAKPPGQGDDEHAAAVEGSIHLLSEQGKLHAAWAALESDEVSKRLSPVQLARLNNALITNERQLLRMPVAEPFHGQMQELLTLRLGEKMRQFSDEKQAVSWLDSQIASINSRWERATGSRQKFVSVSDAVRTQTSVYAYFKEMRNEAVRNAREQAKLVAQQDIDKFQSGLVEQAMLSGGIVPAAVDIDKRAGREAGVYRAHMLPLLSKTEPLTKAESEKLSRLAGYVRASGSNSFREPSEYLTSQYASATAGGTVDMGKIVQVYNAAARLNQHGVSPATAFTDASVASRVQRMLDAYGGAEIKPGTMDNAVLLKSLADPKTPVQPKLTNESKADILTGFKDAANGRDGWRGTLMSMARFRGLRGRLIEDDAMYAVADRLTDAVQAYAAQSHLPISEASKLLFKHMQNTGQIHTTGRHVILDIWNQGSLRDKLLDGRSMNEVDWIHADCEDQFDDAVASIVGEGNKVISMSGARGGGLAIGVMHKNAQDGMTLPTMRTVTYREIADRMRPSAVAAQSKPLADYLPVDKSRPRTWTYGEAMK